MENMTKNEVINEYFEWLCAFVCDETNSLQHLSYRKLLYLLHKTEFTYTIPRDGNRYEEGVELRYRFGYERQYSQSMISCYLDDRPCSVFEMMVALSLHLEEHIMDDSRFGNRTGQWFWNMIVNLGLRNMSDDRFNKILAAENLQKFLNHEYDYNGKGGLFTLKNPDADMRTIEIWYQACRYLNEQIQNG